MKAGRQHVDALMGFRGAKSLHLRWIKKGLIVDVMIGRNMMLNKTAMSAEQCKDVRGGWGSGWAGVAIEKTAS